MRLLISRVVPRVATRNLGGTTGISLTNELNRRIRVPAGRRLRVMGRLEGDAYQHFVQTWDKIYSNLCTCQQVFLSEFFVRKRAGGGCRAAAVSRESTADGECAGDDERRRSARSDLRRRNPASVSCQRPRASEARLRPPRQLRAVSGRQVGTPSRLPAWGPRPFGVVIDIVNGGRPSRKELDSFGHDFAAQDVQGRSRRT
jgi:hypothetical protein